MAVAKPPAIIVSPPAVQTVVTVDGTGAKPRALHQRLRAISQGLDFCEQPPQGWDQVVRDEDEAECGRIYKAVVEIHKSIGDLTYEADIVLENQNAYYKLRVFGLQAPITMEDFATLKALGPRVLSVFYDPVAQATDKEMRGAIGVLISTSLNERERELAKSSLPPIPTPELHAPPTLLALPPTYAVPETPNNGKKRRTIEISLPWPFA